MINESDIKAFFEATTNTATQVLHLKVRPLRGGLDSAGVLHVAARIKSDLHQEKVISFVVKRLAGSQAREAGIYHEVLRRVPVGLAPALLWVQNIPGECRMYLEAIRSGQPWPWRETACSIEVAKDLARLHRIKLTHKPTRQVLANWNYESELLKLSEDLVNQLEAIPTSYEIGMVKKSLPALRRLVSNLPQWRRQLFESFGRALIHGDVHPGNVMIRAHSSRRSPIFLDWGRSRIGSPLEDISSWLQSLGYWEPEARRKHDTLLKAYLMEKGRSLSITRDLRDAYWMAAASNLLAGALLYHLSCLMAEKAIVPARRQAALNALNDCLRVIRRADACWN